MASSRTLVFGVGLVQRLMLGLFDLFYRSLLSNAIRSGKGPRLGTDARGRA